MDHRRFASVPPQQLCSASRRRRVGRCGTNFGHSAARSNHSRLCLDRYRAQPGERLRSGILRAQLGIGILKEIGWGLRPQLSIDCAREVNDGPLVPFDKQRRDWLLEGSFSVYKRNWNIKGFAPSLSLTVTRNFSTVTLYDEKRVRGEIRLTKAL